MAAPRMMSGNRHLGIKVSGSTLTKEMNDAIVDLDFTLSTASVSAFSMTVMDTPGLTLFNHMRPGRTFTYAGYSYRIQTRELGSGSGNPTVKVEGVSKRVWGLQQDTGEYTWGSVDVGSWVEKLAESVKFKPMVEPGLGSMDLARAKPEGDEAESTWDVMVKAKSELGVWMFEYGDKLWFGKPTWIIGQEGRASWKFTWNSLRSHSATLAAVPKYIEDPDNNAPDKQEMLTLSYLSPDATRVRPGDKVTMSSSGKFKFEGIWLVASVTGIGSDATAPVQIECVRPVDPTPRPTKDGGPLGDVTLTSTKGVFDVTPKGPIGGYYEKQLDNARRIVNAALAMGLSKQAQYIGVMTAMGESTLQVLDRGDLVGPDSRGLFQQRDNGAWGSLSERMMPEIAATNFFKALLKVTGWESMEPTIAAHETQNNADPFHYRPFYKTAVKIVDTLHEVNMPAGVTSGDMNVDGNFTNELEAFIRKFNGRSVDYDNNSGAQCVDLLKFYCDELFGLRGLSGHAKFYWTNSKMLTHFTRVSKDMAPRYGDIACYSNTGYGLGKLYGHVDIVLSGSRDGSRNNCFGQLSGHTKKYSMSKAGLQGYLRPKRAGRSSFKNPKPV